MRSSARFIFTPLVTLLIAASALIGQTDDRSVSDLFKEVDIYEAEARKSLLSDGKRYDATARENIQNARKSLAKKYAAETAARPGLKEKDFYYLGRLYAIADNEQKTLEMMNKFLSEIPADAQGAMIQSALWHVVVLSSKAKQLDASEAALERWSKGKPLILSQQPTLQKQLAIAYFKSGKFDQAIKHAQAAFDILRSLTTRNRKEKLDREKIYVELIEILALGYKKSKNTDKAIEVLAEARAESFALPSANLYRKVMAFVEGSDFSEKKMMQKVDSYASADPAPEIKTAEWIGREPVALSELRGKVILLDFWATWCAPCISTFPRLRGWHKKYGGDDFMIVGVTQYYGTQGGKRMSRLQELDFLNSFKEKHALPYAIVIADSGEADMKYGIAAFPTTVLLDRKGIVRYIGIGAGDEESENLEDTIQKVLKETSEKRPSDLKARRLNNKCKL